MKTKLLYLEDSQCRQNQAKIEDIKSANGSTIVTLNKTIFYPIGGGQPSDQGLINGSNGQLKVKHVKLNQSRVEHKGALSGQLEPGQKVELVLNWPLRLKHMSLHTAGHIVDLAIKQIKPQAKSIKGCHGINGQNYIEYVTSVSKEKIVQINQNIEDIIASNLDISTEFVSKKEIEKRGIDAPFQLPKNKPLRLLLIDQYPPMPDGGTHLKNTGSCPPTKVTKIEKQKNIWRVHYQTDTASLKTPHKSNDQSDQNKQKKASVSLSQFEQNLNQLQKKLKQESEQEQDQLQTKYLGKKGLFNQLASQIRYIKPAQRKQAGQSLNQLKTEIKKYLTQLQSDSAQTRPKIDLTMPPAQFKVGHTHPISQAMSEITDIFKRIGFTRVRYPEVDWDWYAFESLNMPQDHPARDEWETFFVDTDQHPKLGKMVLTPHTSNGQVREMERLQNPPIRMINIARCYRRQQDPTHTQMFHQFEGLVVDQGINIQHLKGTIDYFAKEFYGPNAKSRIRPFHFKFTEPSFEVDFSCHICGGSGYVETKDGQKRECKFCKSGWHEVGGAGMVHPNVLEAGGIDPEKYTGFAFGWGVERTYTLREGLNIDDIRLLYSAELDFLEQF